MDFEWPNELLQLRDEAAKVGAEAAADLAVKEDYWINGYDREFSKKLGRRGWIGTAGRRSSGSWSSRPAPRSRRLVRRPADGALDPPLRDRGADADVHPRDRAGEPNWSIGMYEPDNGSDLAHLCTRARVDGDTFVVDGRKVWTSFAATADWIHLICRTDRDAPAHKGLSELIVPTDSLGIEVTPIQDMTTNRHFCEVTFDEVRVPRTTSSASG